MMTEAILCGRLLRTGDYAALADMLRGVLGQLEVAAKDVFMWFYSDGDMMLSLVQFAPTTVATLASPLPLPPPLSPHVQLAVKLLQSRPQWVADLLETQPAVFPAFLLDGDWDAMRRAAGPTGRSMEVAEPLLVLGARFAMRSTDASVLSDVQVLGPSAR